MSAPKVELGQFPSKSEPYKTRTVALSKEGHIYCDCPGFSWRDSCRHIKEYKAHHPLNRVDLCLRISLPSNEATEEEVYNQLVHLRDLIDRTLDSEDYISIELEWQRTGMPRPESKSFNVALVNGELVTIQPIS